MQVIKVDYGTKRKVTVNSASKNLLSLFDDNNEGYLLAHHGLNPIPLVDETGFVTFVKDNLNGHWEYSKV